MEVLLNNFMPAPGDTFDFLFYDDRNNPSGNPTEFSRIESEPIGDMHWEVCYDDEHGKAFLLAAVSGQECP